MVERQVKKQGKYEVQLTAWVTVEAEDKGEAMEKAPRKASSFPGWDVERVEELEEPRTEIEDVKPGEVERPEPEQKLVTGGSGES